MRPADTTSRLEPRFARVSDLCRALLLGACTLGAFTAGGCSDDPPAKKPGADAKLSDATNVDAGPTDAKLTDSAANDTAASDAALNDTTTGDAATSDTATNDTATSDAQPAEDTADKPPQTWSVMVYMAADNNLEKSGILDIEEMLTVSAAKHLRFFVQTDRAEGFYQLGLGSIGAWTGAKRLVIADGTLKELTDLGEVNMGTAASLEGFIAWAAKQGKADKNVLVLWNHGMAWQGFGGDDFDNDQMTLDEIETGLKNGMAKGGLAKFDLAGFDACLMGDLAVARMMKPFAPYLIASEDLEPAHGWNYAAFEAIAKNSWISEPALATAIIDGYEAQAKEQKRQHSITLAVYDNTKLAAVDTAFVALAVQLAKDLDDGTGKPKLDSPVLSALAKARAKVMRFGRSSTPAHDFQMVDIRDLAFRLDKLSDGYESHYKAVNSAISQLVLTRVSGPLTQASRGLSVYFPELSEVALPSFAAVPDMDEWRKVVALFHAAGDASAGGAPKFKTGKCPPGKACAVGAANAQPSCGGGGDLGAAQALQPADIAQAIDAHMLVGYLGSDGEPSVVARVPAEVDLKTGKVNATWKQDVLTVMQGGRSALLFAASSYDGVFAYHEVPMVLAGPAKCPCVLPGDGGWWDTDGDGAANCVDLDDDNDGVKDAEDNCPFVPNSDQSTSTTAGVGKACESAANAPKLKCTPDASNPFGEERIGVLHVRTHQVKSESESWAFYAQGVGGISELEPKSGTLMRPMVLKPVPGKGWQWQKGPPLPMRLDQKLRFSFEPLELTYPDDSEGLPKQDGTGTVVKMSDELKVGDVFLQLQVEGLGKHGDGAFWQGDKDKDIDGQACAPQAPAYCKATEAVDCDGKCWPAERWGDPVCDAGQKPADPNFYCESLGWDKGACAPPECPGGYGILRDCKGHCFAKASQQGDGTCHNGASFGQPNLVCEKFKYDGGDCPCGKNCSEHGTCDSDGKATGKIGCACKDGWTGTYCDVPPTCGDSQCSGAERCDTCPKDCGDCGKQKCGDSTCDGALGEDCTSCEADCGKCACGDGKCLVGSEDCSSCPKDCGKCPVCGDEVCALWNKTAPFTKDKGERCDTCAGDCGACQGECCTASDVKGGSFQGGGCSDATVTKCVCDKSPDCCIFGWTKDCVALAEKDCALSCCVASCVGKECGSDGCGGTCGAGCNDGKACTKDACGTDGKCVFSPALGPCNDGDPCTATSSCSAGKCVGSGNKCDDGDPCTQDVCTAGKCSFVGGTGCNDGNECTTDACTADGKSCVFTPALEGQACDDGDSCTLSTKCGKGECAGGAPLDCDDADPCTTDACQQGKGCVSTSNTGACTDNDACTTNDACVDGSCVAGKALACDDKNPCTNDSCDAKSGCVNLANTANCTDGDSCTNSDTCQGGKCSPGAKSDCDDANPCTDDACNSKSGCVNLSNAATCTDGDACTEKDACKDGKCVAGSAKDCNDANACTSDTCDTASGCVADPIGLVLGKALFKLDYTGPAATEGGVLLESDDVIYVTRGVAVSGWHAQLKRDANGVWKITWLVNSAVVSIAEGTGDLVGATNKDAGGVNAATGKYTKQMDFKTADVADIGVDSKAGLWAVGADLRKYNPTNGAQLFIVPKATVDPVNRPGIAVRGDDVFAMERTTKTYKAGHWTRIVKLDLAGKLVSKFDFESVSPRHLHVTSSGLFILADPGAGRTTVLLADGTPHSYLASTALTTIVDGDGRVVSLHGKAADQRFLQGNDGVSADCKDGDVCTADRCGASKCTVTPTDCDDGNACTADSCAQPVGCTNSAMSDGTSCDDGNACSTTDKCLASACGGQAVQCQSGEVCAQGGQNAGKCLAHCADGLLNGTESDADCGGGCEKCAAGQKCGQNSDCTSASCALDSQQQIKLCVAAKTYTVNNTLDQGVGSLRWAMTEANKNPTLDTIKFSIGSGAKSIDLQSGLPTLTTPTIIDGRTQPAYAGSNLITLNFKQNTLVGVAANDAVELYSLNIVNVGSDGVLIDEGHDSVVLQVVSNGPTSGKREGRGVRVVNSERVKIANCTFIERTTGIQVVGGKDLTVTNNDITKSGTCGPEGASLYVSNVQAGNLAGGVNIAGNKFSADGTCHVLLHKMSNLVIAGAAGGTVNVVLEPIKGHGATTQNGLILNTVSSSSVKDLDLRDPSNSGQGSGLHVEKCSDITIEQVLSQGHLNGIYAADNTGTNIIRCTQLNTNGFGFYTNSSWKLEDSIIKGNTKGVVAVGAITVNAQKNYWGAANGSKSAGGSGDTTEGTVDESNHVSTPPACALRPCANATQCPSQTCVNNKCQL